MSAKKAGPKKEEKKEKRVAPRPATYIPKIGAQEIVPYPEVLAQQFDGEDLEINSFVMKPVSQRNPSTGEDELTHYTTEVRTDGNKGLDVVQPGYYTCIAEGVQRFVMTEAAFRAVYKRKHS